MSDETTALWWHLLNDHGIGPHYLHGNPYNIHAAIVAGGLCEEVRADG